MKKKTPSLAMRRDSAVSILRAQPQDPISPRASAPPPTRSPRLFRASSSKSLDGAATDVSSANSDWNMQGGAFQKLDELPNPFSSRKPLSDADLNRLFLEFDTDRSGEMEFDEFYRAVRQLGARASTAEKKNHGMEHITKKSVRELLALVDTNNDGVVERREWINFFRKTSQIRDMRERLIHSAHKDSQAMRFEFCFFWLAFLVFFVMMAAYFEDMLLGKISGLGAAGLLVSAIALLAMLCKIFVAPVVEDQVERLMEKRRARPASAQERFKTNQKQREEPAFVSTASKIAPCEDSSDERFVSRVHEQAGAEAVAEELATWRAEQEAIYGNRKGRSYRTPVFSDHVFVDVKADGFDDDGKMISNTEHWRRTTLGVSTSRDQMRSARRMSDAVMSMDERFVSEGRNAESDTLSRQRSKDSVCIAAVLMETRRLKMPSAEAREISRSLEQGEMPSAEARSKENPQDARSQVYFPKNYSLAKQEQFTLDPNERLDNPLAVAQRFFNPVNSKQVREAEMRRQRECGLEKHAVHGGGEAGQGMQKAMKALADKRGDEGNSATATQHTLPGKGLKRQKPVEWEERGGRVTRAL